MAAKGIAIGKAFCASELEGIYEKVKSGLSGKKKNVTLDMKNVERIDTLGLQLLVSLQSSCKAKGGELTLKNMPNPVTDVINLLGLSILINE